MFILGGIPDGDYNVVTCSNSWLRLISSDSSTATYEAGMTLCWVVDSNIFLKIAFLPPYYWLLLTPLGTFSHLQI